MKNSNEQKEDVKLAPTKKATKTKGGKISEWKGIVQTSRQATTSECFCSICMEVIVDTTVVNPCGHIFCASCILCKKLHKRDCPNCRTRMQSTTRCKPMDTIIKAMAMRGDFRLGDFVQYLKQSDTILKQRKVRNNTL